MDVFAQGTAPAIETDYEKVHGRIEQRGFWLKTEIDWLESKDDWPGLKSLALWKGHGNPHMEPYRAPHAVIT